MVYTSVKDSAVKPSDLGKNIEYEYAFTINDIPAEDTQITVTPYVVTKDGKTVLSEAGTFSLGSVK